MAVYAAAVCLSTAAARVGEPYDRAFLPVVYATMHFSWGAGFLRTCIADGPPIRAALEAIRHAVSR